MTVLPDDLSGIATHVPARTDMPDGAAARRAAAQKLAALLAQGYGRMPLFP